MKKLFACIASTLLAISSLVAPGLVPAAHAEQLFKLDGFVGSTTNYTFNHPNGVPTPRIEVTLPGSSQVVASLTGSDNTGLWYDLMVPAGTYDIHVSSPANPNYLPVTHSSVVIDSNTYVGTIMSVNGSVIVPPPPSRVWSGVLRGANGQPLPNSIANLYFSWCNPNTSYVCFGKGVATDAAGRFKSIMPQDTYKFDVGNSSGPVAFFRAKGDFDLTTDRTTDINFAATDDVAVSVHDSLNQPVVFPIGPGMGGNGSVGSFFSGATNTTMTFGTNPYQSSQNANFSYKVFHGLTYTSTVGFSSNFIGYRPTSSSPFVAVDGINVEVVVENQIDAPKNLAVISSSPHPTLSWGVPDWSTTRGIPIHHYNVYRDGTPIGSSSTTQFADGAPLPGLHTYSVSAVNHYDVYNIEGAKAAVSFQSDATAPLVTGTPDRTSNGNGWYDNDVIVSWNAVDPAPSSGAPSTPPLTMATLEGTHLYTSDPSCDPAGNCATGSLSLSIDKTAPTIVGSSDETPNANDWFNIDVTTAFVCSDTVSGVDTCSSPITVGEGASQSVEGAVTDRAGNTASTVKVLNVDKTTPVISYTLSPVPNGSGWNNSAVTVNFSCSDALSGVQSCTGPVTVNEGANQVVTAVAADLAGNTKTINVVVSVDETTPTIAYTVSPSPNPAGWNKSNVTVAFACTDGLSGIQSCTAPITVTGDTAGQQVVGTAVDYAGNTASITASIKLDKTLPTTTNLTMSGLLTVPPLGSFFIGNTSQLSADATDSLSGVVGGEYYLDTDPGTGNGTAMAYASGRITATANFATLSRGWHTLYVRSRDGAGNWSTPAALSFRRL